MANTMRAVLVTEFGGPDVLREQTVAAPLPGPGQVLIRTEHTSVNFADIKSRKASYRGKEAPFIPGLDGAGTVESVGTGVAGFAQGDRVAAYAVAGSYAQFFLADARLCFRLPHDVPTETGAALGIFITAYNTLTLAGRLQAGEKVLIHAGAGGVGSSAVQMAKALGAAQIIVTVGSEEKRATATGVGASETINYRNEDFSQRTNEMTDGAGVDLILDSIAGDVAEKGMDCLANFGRLVVFGHTQQGAANFNSKQLHSQNRAVIGYSSGGYRKGRPERLRASGEAVLKLVSEGKLKLLVGGRFPLAEAALAHELVESRRSVGKILLVP